MGASEKRRYESLYVLVDRVDETAAGVAGALPLLRSLVVKGGLLGSQRVAFKFFLPHDIGEQLLTAAEIHRDRFIIESITWDETSLAHLLEMRLRHYSNEYVEHMTQLCTPWLPPSRRAFGESATAPPATSCASAKGCCGCTSCGRTRRFSNRATSAAR